MKISELKKNNVYFVLTFHDSGLLMPDIKTYIYLGVNLISAGSNTIFFQGAEQYVELGAWTHPLDPVEYDVLIMQEDFLEYVFDYSGLQDQIELMKNGGANYYPD